MAHSHHHDHDGPVPLGQAARWVVIGVLSLAAVAVAIGLVVLWPSSGQDHPIPMQFRSADGGPIRTQTGVVVAMSRADCGNQMVGIAVDAQETLGVTPTADGPCRAATVRLRDGEDKGKYVLLQIPTNRAQAGTGPGQPEPDLATAAFEVAHDRGQNHPALPIGQALGHTVSDAGHQRVGGAQVDANGDAALVRVRGLARFRNLQ